MVDAEYNEEFLRGVLSRLEWNALRKSAAEVSERILINKSKQPTRWERGRCGEALGGINGCFDTYSKQEPR